MNKLVNGKLVALTSEEKTARAAEEQEEKKYMAANGYKFKRAAEYPSIADQLDDIYHNGIDGWKATIKATKDKYPKS